MNKLRIAALAAATVMLTAGVLGNSPASAACNASVNFPGDDAGALNTISVGGETFYFDYRGDDELWIYRESNGVAGLQRGGSHAHFGPLASPDSCQDGHPAGADELIY